MSHLLTVFFYRLTSDILVGGGGSTNYLEGNAGNDLAVGGCSLITFSDNHLLDMIMSTFPDVGTADVILVGDGNDIAIGGYGNDTVEG